jgi:transcription termination/antitermination protein NusG
MKKTQRTSSSMPRRLSASAPSPSVILPLLSKLPDNAMKPKRKIIFRIGDRVRIKAGPFGAFTGKVEGINQSKSLLKVAIDIFGRVTPVKVQFSEAEKLEFERPLPPGSTQN